MRKYILTLGIILTAIITIPTYAYRSRDVTSIWTDPSRTTLAKEICDSDVQGCPSASCWLPNGMYYDLKGTFTETCSGGEYTFLEYIESTGTQYIDTGYAYKNETTRTQVKFAFTSNTTIHRNLFGCSRNGTNFITAFQDVAGVMGIYVCRDRYALFARTNYEPHTIDISTPASVGSGLYITIDGVQQSYTKNASNISNANMGIFTQIDSVDTLLRLNRLGSYKVYSFTMTDGGTIVRDMVPAKRNSDNAIGMYDRVNNKFYGNSGSGTFVAGPTELSFDQSYAQGLTDCSVAACPNGAVYVNGTCQCTGGAIYTGEACQCLLGSVFSSCADPYIDYTAYGYWDFSGSKSNTSTHNLTAAGQWGATFSYGKIKGIASCNSTPDTPDRTSSANFTNTANGRYCWCKMTSPAASLLWGYEGDFGSASTCTDYCARGCGDQFLPNAPNRLRMYLSVQ